MMATNNGAGVREKFFKRVGARRFKGKMNCQDKLNNAKYKQLSSSLKNQLLILVYS